MFRLSKYPAKLTYDASLVESRAVDPHSFFADADLDPGVLLNPDPVPAAFLMRTRIQLNKKFNKFHYEEFSGVENDKTKGSKVKKKPRSWPKFTFFLPGSVSVY